jgi:transcriptional regulator with PAS, ATPase and Fis domain
MIYPKLTGQNSNVNNLEIIINKTIYLINSPTNLISVSETTQVGELCYFTIIDGQVTVTATSLNKNIYVNHNVVTDTVLLQHNDLIQAGDAYFIFVSSDVSAKEKTYLHIEYKESPLQIAPQVNQHSSNLIFDPVFLKQKSNAEGLRNIQVIYDRLASFDRIDELSETLLHELLKLVQADFAAVILKDNDFAEEYIYRQNRPEKKASSMYISRFVKNLIIGGNHNKSFVYESTATENLVDSVRTSNIRSALATPLLPKDTKNSYGVLYLYSETDGALSLSDLILVSHLASLLAPRIQDLLRIKSLETKYEVFAKKIGNEFGIIGRCPEFLKVVAAAKKVAAFQTDVLILGESGVGKQGLAEYIHRNSPRKNSPFIALNCGAVSSEMFESELFGHEKGAFTDAKAAKKGLLEMAEGGTFFFDELGALATNHQVKLLTMLQERKFRRAGGVREIPINVRVIAATNENLQQKIAQGSFREDLYYRFASYKIEIPPLRKRIADIPLLADHFFTMQKNDEVPHLKGISNEALQMLKLYTWPGNIRELKNAIATAVINSAPSPFDNSDEMPEMLLPTDFPETIRQATVLPNINSGDFDEAVKAFKQQFVLNIIEELRQSKNNGLLKGRTINQELGVRLGRSSNNLARFLEDCGLKECLTAEDKMK